MALKSVDFGAFLERDAMLAWCCRRVCHMPVLYEKGST